MNLEKKKKEVDLKKIEAAVAELEYKIEERKADIERMRDHIALQIDRKTKILEELTN